MFASKKREKPEQVSHKVIEKRRRDRINNCLVELSQTVPAAFAKQTSGKLEKAEILEMTVEYVRALHSVRQRLEKGDWLLPELQNSYTAGFTECVHEVLRYLTEVEGMPPMDSRCIRMAAYLHTRNNGAKLPRTTNSWQILHRNGGKEPPTPFAPSTSACVPGCYANFHGNISFQKVFSPCPSTVWTQL